MAHHVLLGEKIKEETFHGLEHIHGLQQSAAAGVGQVNLRDIAGDYGLGVEAHAGHEHLHLLRRRILRFVQDDERIVERAATHEGDRRNLNDVLLQKAVDALLVHQVIERVIQRTQIRIDLFLQRSRQKAQALARLDRRPRQDDAAHALGVQRRNGHRHGQIGFARTRRPDAEHHVVLFNGVNIAALVHALGLDLALAKRSLLARLSHPPQGCGGVGHHHAQHGAEIGVRKFLASAAEVVEVGKDLLSAHHVPGGALKLHGIRLQIDIYVEAAFQHLQVFVANAEELLDVRDNFNIFLHSVFADASRISAHVRRLRAAGTEKHKIALCMKYQVSWPTGTRR